ncbi:GNAT family N-acetyltransferase [Streptomyces sp. 3MP-14]|uniref:GNAT family N-acetyltransferase n=1 Tax=Streptomyces mimosae TaxID=2586635 RepID=A0A5N5ZL50_9ACTN|nr:MULTISPECIES: GNAT family N-acetyltransferase [Streptomyces]KAB8157075.1 GNAT family N-acetyltransferase [Streptomyces mimosae]KAB8172698.1 GNAT family N-acetyltransferase [Streptomyces sp. 3MP-14]
MTYRVRRVGREDWERLRELRLAALSDPVAHLAFFEPYEKAVRLGQEDWQRRASDGERPIFVGETADGKWVGMVGLLTVEAHVEVVGVYIAPEHRGTGLAARLMRAAIEGAGGREVRLRVHQNNARAARFYANLGFQPTGASAPDPRDPTLVAYELAYRGD